MSEETKTPSETPPEQQSQNFAAQAEEKPPGLIAEFVDFLLHNKKWWLMPKKGASFECSLVDAAARNGGANRQ